MSDQNEQEFSPTKGISWNPKEMLGKLYDENISLKSENKEMKDLLKLILETDCLPHWAYERGDDEESIAEMVRKFVKESK